MKTFFYSYQLKFSLFYTLEEQTLSFTLLSNYVILINIMTIFQVLNYVSTLLEMPEELLAELSFQNASRLFSYPGSKVGCDG